MITTIQNHLKSVNNTLRAFSLKLTGDMADAEDLYQDTAIRIISNADKFQTGTNFKAWAVTIMRNVFINNYRKKTRRSVILDQTSNNYCYLLVTAQASLQEKEAITRQQKRNITLLFN